MPVSPETSLIVAYLKTCYESEQLVLFSELGKIVPRIKNSRRHHLTKALDILAEDYGYHFQNVRALGYRPLNDDSSKLKTITRKRTNRIGTQINKWRGEWETIKMEVLTPEETKKYIATSIKLSAHEQLHNPEFDKRVSAIAANTTQPNKILYSKEAIKALIDVS